ncbi:MAG: mannosyl-3-phosphoglycerate synthase [Candidatus Bipolaricaulia bacterium]
MRIETPRYTERFGAVRLNDVQKVLELDAGRGDGCAAQEGLAVQRIDEATLRDVEQRMAIVLPTKDEKLKLFEGVIGGIPHECLMILVSNSERERVDHFRMEWETLEQYCQFTRRHAIAVHQKDPTLGRALQAAGYPHVLDDDGLIRDGKAEGMIVGMLLAKLAGKDYVGFIDADNYFPGSVWEYVRSYAAGLSMANSPYSMVRILWRYKPKLSTHGFYFKKWGRVSQTTNRVMNALVSINTGFETDVVKTGNAGEHAMSIRLAEILPYAAGFAVEPQELLSIFEAYGGIHAAPDRDAARQGVQIVQLESRNPHLHEDKGQNHLLEMLMAGLGAVYHSSLSDDTVRDLIRDELDRQGALPRDHAPPCPTVMPPFGDADVEALNEALGECCHDIWISGRPK